MTSPTLISEARAPIGIMFSKEAFAVELVDALPVYSISRVEASICCHRHQIRSNCVWWRKKTGSTT